MKASHGLVIGKFYPPHPGHHLLIRTAAAVSQRVSVVVMAASVESIALADRVAWLREVHALEPHVHIVGIVDDLRVDYDDEAIWQGHVALMRSAVAQITSEAVDAVFTSEAYGDELARRFDARHVRVDQPRALMPFSGTAVRADPSAAWDVLEPCVRAGLALRVVLAGAESTGKTTLASDLAQRLRQRGSAFERTRWVPEYGRQWSIDKLAAACANAQLQAQPIPGPEQLDWHSDEFLAIACEQNRREESAAREGGPVLICDTDAFVTGIWHERYMGRGSAEVDATARCDVRRLYLLTHPDDVPFEQDGLRDGEAIRAWMTRRFVERLQLAGLRWQWLRGSGREARVERALSAIAEALHEAWSFAPPLG